MAEFMKIWEDQQVPWETRRREIVATLCHEEYGETPPEPDAVSWEIRSEDESACDGRAVMQSVILTAAWDGRSFSFPFRAFFAKSEKRTPFFVNLGFDEELPNRFLDPAQLCGQGVSVLYVYYQDVTADNDDFTDGLAGALYPDGKRDPHGPGKIAMWAWATRRVLDFALQSDRLDASRAAVAGHSRLGKTALLAAATDERFTHAVSNNSGCCGAAVSRGKEGETIADICNVYGYWFCESFRQYANREDALPFDQHFLLASIAPRKIAVGSADRDRWAGPIQERLSCALASEVYRKLGLSGLVAPDRPPQIGDNWTEGEIAYHYREGGHFLRADDWDIYCEFLKR